VQLLSRLFWIVELFTLFPVQLEILYRISSLDQLIVVEWPQRFNLCFQLPSLCHVLIRLDEASKQLLTSNQKCTRIDNDTGNGTGNDTRSSS
jgi:hypothetical protein